MGFKWNCSSKNSAKVLHYNGQCVGELIVRPCEEIEILGETIDEVKEGIFAIKWNFFATNAQRPLSITIDFVANYSPEWCMIPAVSYNGNDWGRGHEPKGFEKDGIHWVFSYSRTSVAGATYSEGKKWGVALFAPVDKSLPPFSCSLIPGDDKVIHRLIWPEQEKPFSYYQRDTYREPFELTWCLKEGGFFSITVYLVVVDIGVRRLSYATALDFAWTVNYHRLKPWFTPGEIWDLGHHYATNYLFVKDRIFTGFSKGLKWNGQEWYKRPTAKYLVGWTGQNLSLANSMIYSFIMTNNKADLNKALETFESWANYGRVGNGLIHCLFDYVLGDADSKEEVQDACNLAEAASNFFEGWDLLKRCGIDMPKYRDIALGICDFAVRQQSSNGSFGKSWTNDGICVDPQGTIGCYFVMPLIRAYEITGDKRYINAAKAGYEFYMDSFLSDGYTTAAALDTYCIDKESAIPLLKSSLLLYQVEHKEHYIEKARLVSYYLATWQWHYSVLFPENTPLYDMGYDTFGGTSVSVQHHHLDPFALAFVVEWLKLSELTGEDIWRQRAIAAWANATFGISDGNLTVKGVKRPRGSQDEGFYHTHWGAPNENIDSPMGNVSCWLVAWPTAFRLQVLRQLKEMGKSWKVLEGKIHEV